jgi:hypothetical protein
MGDKMTGENTYQTSIRIPMNLYNEIEKLAQENERKPAEQIRFMLKEYIRLKESLK